MNVTPLIDVMLVLIIVFMLAPPQSGLDVTLPREYDDGQSVLNPIHLTVASDGALAINRQPIDRERLPGVLRDIFESRADKSLIVQAHERLRYAEVVTVLDIARGSGVERVGIWRAEPRPIER